MGIHLELAPTSDGLLNISILEEAGFSPALGHCLTLLNLAIFVIAVTGNSLVLLGTIKHDLIKMDRPSLLFLQSIAISDIVIAFSSYLIRGITLAFDRWVLGRFICKFSKILFTTALFNEAGVIAMLSVYRVWMLKKPRAARQNINGTIVKIVLFFSFFVGALYLSILISALEAPMFVNAKEHTCSSAVFRDVQYRIYAVTTVVVFVFVPMFVIVVSNVVTLVVFLRYHHKARQRLTLQAHRDISRVSKDASRVSKDASRVSKESYLSTSTTTPLQPGDAGLSCPEYYKIIVTLTALSATFVVSYFLILVKNTMGLLKAPVPGWLVVAWPYLLSVNVMVNPLIYALMNKKFKVFLKEFFVGKCASSRE